MRLQRTQVTWSQLRVGFFTLICVSILLWLVLFAGNGIQAVQNRFTVQTILDSATGLRAGDPVRLAGIEVGTVKKIKFVRQNGVDRVRIQINLNQKAEQRLRSNSVVQIKSVGFTESRYVEISLGTREGTPVTEVGPLQGMPLQKLWLNRTQVSNLNPLAGMPLRELNLLETSVEDLSPLQGMPLEMLWLNDTPVTDIDSLSGMPLLSLTLKGTAVKDLTVVRQLPRLERLHAGDTRVTDLTPLKDLHLTRLIFTPGRIQNGLEEIRQMETLREIGTTFEDRMPPAEFWEKYGPK